MKSFLKCLALILCFTFALALLPADVSAADKPVGGVTAVADKVEWNSTYSAYAPKFTSIQAVDTEGNPVSYDATSTCLYQEYKNGSLANKVTGLKYDTTYYSAIYIENPDGKKNISHSLVNISIPGYKVMYWDSSLQDGGATVRIVYRAVRIGVYMGGVAIANGYYLAAGSDQATSVRPADHYAYLKDGVLTLHNYTHNVTASNGSDVGILSFMDLTVKVEGTNTITTDGVGINSQEGDLRIEGTVNDSLTINSGSRAIYVYGDLVLDHKGTLNINSGNHAIDCLGPGNEVKIQSGNINIIGYLNCIWLGNHDLTVSGGKVEMLSTAPNSSCIYIAASTVCVNINGGELYLTCEDDVIFNGKFFVTGGKVLMRSCDEESGTVLYCTSVDIASSLTVKASTEPYGTLSAYDPAKNDSYKLVTIGNPADKVYSYKITYDADGGTGDLAPQTVRFGESVTLPENPYEAPANKKFFGWMFMEGSSYDLYDVGEVLTPKKDMTFKAYWAEKISEVNIFVKNPVVGMLCGDAYVYPPLGANYDVGIDYWYMVKDGTYPHPSPADPFEKGDYRLRMKIVPNLGYYFDDSTVFTVNGKSTTNYSPHPNTFVAYREMKFNVDETAIYNVHFDANGGTVTPTFTATKANGKVESLPTPTHSDDKKEFVGWFDAKTGGKKVTTDTVFTDDTLIYAQWKDKAPVPTTFTVTFDGNGGSGTMADVTDINGEYTLPACAFTAPAGKEFKAWSVDGTEKAAGDKITVTENITITAVWKDKEVIPTTYTVTFDGNGGSGTMAAVTDVSGEYTLPACAFTAPAGKEFKAWNVNGTEKAAGDKINVTENITITAVWKDKEVVPITYTITFNANGGKVTPATATTGADGKLTSLPTPTHTDSNKVFDGWYTTKTGTTKVTTATVFTADTTIYAHWKEKSPAPITNPFTDVKAGDYFFDPVMWAVKEGITAGTSSTTFEPNTACTRAHAVTFLWRAAGEPAPKSSTMPFTDVQKGSYYEKAVLWAAEKGITAGTSATTFSPDDPCTRGQIVTFLWRFENKPSVSGSHPFTDVPKGFYYEQPVIWAVKEGITNGTSATTFEPDAKCTRGQIVTFLYRDIVL